MVGDPCVQRLVIVGTIDARHEAGRQRVCHAAEQVGGHLTTNRLVGQRVWLDIRRREGLGSRVYVAPIPEMGEQIMHVASGSVILAGALMVLVGACTPGANVVSVTPVPADSATEPPSARTAATAYPPPRLTQEASNATAAAIESDRRATAAAVGLLTPVTASNMVTYSNPILGLSFSYPVELGEVVARFWHSAVGGIGWELGFDRFDALSFEGRSPDFSADRGLMDGDTLGFERDDNGAYRWKFATGSPGTDIDVMEVLDVDGGPIVMFRLPPPMGWGETEPWPEHPAALVNLAGDDFPGFIAIPRDSDRLPLDVFVAILQTIRVAEPDLPPPTVRPDG